MKNEKKTFSEIGAQGTTGQRIGSWLIIGAIFAGGLLVGRKTAK